MQTNLFIVALTGGIGSGKTLVSDRFAEHGVPVIDTDIIARQVVEPGQACLIELIDAFGSDIVEENGDLNRTALRELAFASPANKSKLDAITHPAIFQETLSQIQAVHYPYCLIVIPLLQENSPFLQISKRILTVSAKEEIRIQRVMQRNNFSRQQVEGIMQTQLNDAQRREFSDDEIINQADKQSVYQTVDTLHKYYLALASQQ